MRVRDLYDFDDRRDAIKHRLEVHRALRKLSLDNLHVVELRMLIASDLRELYNGLSEHANAAVCEVANGALFEHFLRLSEVTR